MNDRKAPTKASLTGKEEQVVLPEDGVGPHRAQHLPVCPVHLEQEQPRDAPQAGLLDGLAVQGLAHHAHGGGVFALGGLL